MTRLSLLALTIAAIAASPARASHMGEVSVSASVVYSARVLPAQVVSVRRVGAEGRGRMIASVRSGGRGPLLIEQRGGAVVQLATPESGRDVSVSLPDAGQAQVELIVTVFSDGAPGWQSR
jgi:hypothetical protein